MSDSNACRLYEDQDTEVEDKNIKVLFQSYSFSICLCIPHTPQLSFSLPPRAFISVSLTLGLCQDLSVLLPAMQPANSFKVISRTVVQLASFISHLSGITALRCLISSVSQTVVSYFFSSLFGCCKCQGQFGPCYSILIESGSQNY